MTKKLYIILISIGVLILGGLSVYAILSNRSTKVDPGVVHSEEYLKYEKIFNFELSTDSTYYIIKGIKKDSQTSYEITIPESIDNIPVIKIISQNGNFSDLKNVSKLYISKNITYIGNKKDSSSLEDISLYYPNSFKTWEVSNENSTYASEDGVLYNKAKTVLLQHPNTTIHFVVPSSVTRLGNNAFYGNTMLKSIDLASVLEVGSNCFYHADSLYQINSGTNLETIEKEAFSFCPALVKIDGGMKLKTIGSAAFSYCDNLVSITLHTGLVTIGEHIFTGSTNFDTIYTEEANVETFKNLFKNQLGSKVVIKKIGI